ncbi:hypothetical protein [Sphingomonas sp. BK036]|nr:hypothetical protein [Sphingomonas sp. BK036]
MRVLRAAGLIETTQTGREMISMLPRSDFDRRFRPPQRGARVRTR